jgi:hypothetical protein
MENMCWVCCIWPPDAKMQAALLLKRTHANKSLVERARIQETKTGKAVVLVMRQVPRYFCSAF